MIRRRCRRAGCDTVLERSNPGPTCWRHTPDLTQGVSLAHIRGRRRYTERRGVMSEAFLGNVAGAYRLTKSERKGIG